MDEVPFEGFIPDLRDDNAWGINNNMEGGSVVKLSWRDVGK